MSYLPIRVSTLKSDIILGFDLYVALPHKHLLYIRKEEPIESERITRLKEKRVRKLFIRDSEEVSYQNYIDRCLEEMMDDDSVSLETKANVVVGASETSCEKIFNDPHSQKSYNTAKKTAKNLISVLTKNDELLKEIFNVAPTDDDSIEARMHRHALNTSSLCIGFSDFLGGTEEERELLAMGGLFHDIGFSQLNDEGQKLFMRPLKEMSPQDASLYKEHPRLGAEILQDKEFASAELIDLIISHEERRGGNGFPHKLQKLSKRQEILAVCALYDTFITLYKFSREEALEEMSLNQMGNFDFEFLKSFKKFVKHSGMNN